MYDLLYIALIAAAGFACITFPDLIAFLAGRFGK